MQESNNANLENVDIISEKDYIFYEKNEVGIKEIPSINLNDNNINKSMHSLCINNDLNY